MEIRKTKTFEKNCLKRITAGSQTEKRLRERIAQFMADRRNPILHDHALVGQEKELRAFWVTGDIRIVYYQLSDEIFVFADIGTHNQVYS